MARRFYPFALENAHVEFRVVRDEDGPAGKRGEPGQRCPDAGRPPQLALDCADACLAAGVRVGCFRPPSVPDGISRLRLTAHADLTRLDLERATRALGAAAELVAAASGA